MFEKTAEFREETCADLAAAVVGLAKEDLVKFNPGDPEFDSAVEFLDSGALFAALPVEDHDSLRKLIVTQVTKERELASA